MKNIISFLTEKGIPFQVITYKSQGFKVRRKGLDFAGFGFEPVDHSDGDKWFLRSWPEGYAGRVYFKRLTLTVVKSLLYPKLEVHLEELGYYITPTATGSLKNRFSVWFRGEFIQSCQYTKEANALAYHHNRLRII